MAGWNERAIYCGLSVGRGWSSFVLACACNAFSPVTPLAVVPFEQHASSENCVPACRSQPQDLEWVDAGIAGTMDINLDAFPRCRELVRKFKAQPFVEQWEKIRKELHA